MLRDKMAWMRRRIMVTDHDIDLKGAGATIMQVILLPMPPRCQQGDEHPAQQHHRHAHPHPGQPVQTEGGRPPTRQASERRWLLHRRTLSRGPSGDAVTGHLNVGADRDRGRRDRLSRLIAPDAARSAGRIEPLVIELLIREDIRGRHGGVCPARVICWRSIVWCCHDLMPLPLHRLPTKDAAGIIRGREPTENGLVEFLNACCMFVALMRYITTKAVLVVD